MNFVISQPPGGSTLCQLVYWKGIPLPPPPFSRAAHRSGQVKRSFPAGLGHTSLIHPDQQQKARLRCASANTTSHKAFLATVSFVYDSPYDNHPRRSLSSRSFCDKEPHVDQSQVANCTYLVYLALGSRLYPHSRCQFPSLVSPSRPPTPSTNPPLVRQVTRSPLTTCRSHRRACHPRTVLFLPGRGPNTGTGPACRIFSKG